MNVWPEDESVRGNKCAILIVYVITERCSWEVVMVIWVLYSSSTIELAVPL
jgi:hypothetical protein